MNQEEGYIKIASSERKSISVIVMKAYQNKI